MLSYLLHCQFVGAIPVGFVIYNDISKYLGGIVTHRISPYKQFGNPQGHRLYVYKDSRSKSQWEFAYEKQPGGDVVIWGIIINGKSR